MSVSNMVCVWCFFFQAEDGIRDLTVTGVQTCALPISRTARDRARVPCRLLERPRLARSVLVERSDRATGALCAYARSRFVHAAARRQRTRARRRLAARRGRACARAGAPSAEFSGERNAPRRITERVSDTTVWDSCARRA